MLSIQIHNDGTGSTDIGNYDYKVFINDEVIASGRVEGWERKYGWIGLVDTLCLYEQEKAALADTKEIGDE